ncbi:MAG TPA: pitrilysin family protein [Kofleriaceae bacterium]|nr:pitrilysin family protein [Kofleriaceae bacterium]
MRSRSLRLAGAVLLTAALGASAAAQSAAPKTSDPTIPFERYNLDNGLEVILHQDNTVPLVAVDVWYHVGSGDERPGKSGFAHLFEHMLFQDSVHVGEDKFFETLKSVGSSQVNGSTNSDRTNYFEVVPSHQVETALWLESDRMGYFLPTLTEASFKGQQEVVRNERRQNYDNRPYGRARFALHKMLYPEGHPYRYMTIGRHEDLEAASVDDVRQFYKTWYTPANATLVIAGDFETPAMKELVQKWFGSFPKSKRPVHRTVPMPEVAHQRQTVKDPFAKLRLLQYAWHTPAFFAAGDAELDIVSGVLLSGTGRLHRRLVIEEQLAVNVGGGQQSMGHSSIFQIAVVLKTGADMARAEAIIDEELQRIAKEPVTKREFDRVVAQTESGFVWGLQGLLSRAETLHRYNHYVGNPDYIKNDLDRLRTSSPAKVRDVAAKYLRKDRRVEILTVPDEGAKAEKGTK